MHLGDQGDSLVLELVGYQFERATSGDDANWLQVRVLAEVDGKRWEAITPCLLTEEVSRLADWLECLAEGAEVPDLDFLEPNLSFDVAERGDDCFHVRAWFELELRPVWAESGLAGERDLAANLKVNREELKRAAKALRGQLAAFPPRP